MPWYNIPTCGTWPGWCCRRRWAWLRGLWHIWDHSQLIILQRLDIKNVHVCFWKYDWPLGLVDIVEIDGHDYEAPDISESETIPNWFFLNSGHKHVPCVFLRLWRTHLWHSAWLTLSTKGATSMPATYLRPNKKFKSSCFLIFWTKLLHPDSPSYLDR